MTTDSKVNPGSDDDEATVTIVMPMSFPDHQRMLRACQIITDERGQLYTIHDLLCDATSLAVLDIEKGAPDEADDATDADEEGAA